MFIKIYQADTVRAFIDNIHRRGSLSLAPFVLGKSMTMPRYVPTPALKDKFETVALGFDREIVDRVMRGLPVSNDNSPDVRELRQAWSRYHERIRN